MEVCPLYIFEWWDWIPTWSYRRVGPCACQHASSGSQRLMTDRYRQAGRRVKSHHHVSSSGIQCSHRDPHKLDPATNATQAGEGGRDPYEVPHHPSPIEMLPTRPRSPQRSRRQKQMACPNPHPAYVSMTSSLPPRSDDTRSDSNVATCTYSMSPRDGILQISDAEKPGLWAGPGLARQGPENLMG